MVFSSSIFLLYFFPAFLLLYYMADPKFKNYLLLGASILFYSWGEPVYIFVILISTIADYYIVNMLYKADTQSRKKLFLALSIATNVGLLVFFKYANFILSNFHPLFGSGEYQDVHWMGIDHMPIGISFYTFQTLTYSIDIYRGKHKPLKKASDYLMYILMFPQLIAGPIVRFSEVAGEIIDRRKNDTIDDKLLGLYRFFIGLGKKVLIANVVGAQADKIFALPEEALTTPLAWIGILAYAFQIYFDFSGYSDMAIGIGRMLGFKFPENFNNPYISQSITEFWRRWHITLGRWMRDYLYIPLGGSRVNSKFRLYFNLWFVFLVSGLWHGAAWNFVLWGAFHGFFLILDRLFLMKAYEKMGKVPSIVITFIITLVGWVLFRAESMSQISWFTKKMFAFDFAETTMAFTSEFWVIMIIAICFSFLTAFRFGLNIEKTVFFKDTYKMKGIIVMSVLSMVILIISLSSITSSGFNPFIYFRF